MEDGKYYSEEQKRKTQLFKRCQFLGDDGSYSKDNYWKNPVKVEVPQDQADAMAEAIRFFTGGSPSRTSVGCDRVMLQSKGYYHHIGA